MAADLWQCPNIEQYATRWYGHSTRVASEAEFDAEFMDWICEAYAVGEQKHLDSPKL